MDIEKLKKAMQLIQECIDGEDQGEESEDMEMESEDGDMEGDVSDKIRLAASLMKRKG